MASRLLGNAFQALQADNVLLAPFSILILLALLGFISNHLLWKLVSIWADRTQNRMLQDIVRYFRHPGKLILPVLFTAMGIPFLYFPKSIVGILADIFYLLFVFSLTWLSLRTVYVFRDAILRKYAIMVKEDLRARRIHTQVGIVVRMIKYFLLILALSFMLLHFRTIRRIGIGVLASAGVIGVILGFSAQKSIANLLVGIQVAISQPIRINDVVIVENEWGWIEEISLTYVVVKLWDLRRLIVPVSYFIENPFQNWTRISADLLGTVYLYTDYRVPVHEVREELNRILKDTGLWDGRVWNLQVTNLTEKTVELRALMSASDSPAAWNLRCHVREKLLEFLQRKYPESLPHLRIEISKAEKHGHRQILK
ncbi:MAG: mechanosensitive ion channel family protein [bacterium]